MRACVECTRVRLVSACVRERVRVYVRVRRGRGDAFEAFVAAASPRGDKSREGLNMCE